MNTPRIIPPSELIINGDGSAFHIHLRPDQLRDNIIFVGDRMTPGGNDYPAAQAGAIALQVTGPQDTVRLCDILLPLLGGEPVRQDG